MDNGLPGNRFDSIHAIGYTKNSHDPICSLRGVEVSYGDVEKSNGAHRSC